ncbi:MAG: hypothetical protein Kow0047_08470 [Anaerolineae bacterium]
MAPKSLGILADDPMAEAGRKAMRFHFERMLAHEEGTRSGQDIEELHDMRVAVRRMRSALQLFGSCYKRKTVRRLRRGLSAIGRVLGAVRDLDILIARMELYMAPLSDEEQAALRPLVKAWRGQRLAARAIMIDYLDSDAYRCFVERLRAFVETPGMGAMAHDDEAISPVLVRHALAPQVWQRYAAVRAYDAVLPPADTGDGILSVPLPTLHALRIECKRLRYTLEFFQEVLPPEAADLIGVLVRAQDHLGDLHDAHVACELVGDYVARRERKARRKGKAIDLDGARAFLDSRKALQRDLLESFPPLWAELSGDPFRRRLAEVVAAV